MDEGNGAASCKFLSMKRESKDSRQRQMSNESDKNKEYWIDEIAFLEARLNGSQGDIDSEDRSACEEALKTAKTNLSAYK